MSLQRGHPSLAAARADEILDGWVFSAGRAAVDCVWRAGVKVVENGRHRGRDALRERYSKVLQRLAAAA